MFEALTRKFQFRFKDRTTAANILGDALKDTVKKDQIPNVVILGIPRGGVITADIVARKLSSTFDIVIPRKLTDPDNKEQAIGAIMEDGSTYLDEHLICTISIDLTKEVFRCSNASRYSLERPRPDPDSWANCIM